MSIPEQRFRKLCRGEYGGFESAKFRDALNKSSDDPVPVEFDVGFRETKTVMLSRAIAEQYARIADEEAAPETNLLKSIKPEMRNWILQNRTAMCERLRAGIKKYNPEYGAGIQIIWSITTPDVVPYETATEYVKKYGGEQ